MRNYSAVDIELIKRSPLRMTVEQGADLGRCETVLRQSGDLGAYRVRLHLLIRAAANAHEREGVPSPWTPDYDLVVGESKDPGDPLPQGPATIDEHILAHLATHGRTRREDLIVAVCARGYAEASVGSRITALAGDGKIVRPAHGIYDIGKRGPKAGKRKDAEQEQA